MKRIVVAYDKNRGIGAANDIMWLSDMPADMKHFREVTTGTSLIMGRKTFESIGRALPNRQNIVISRSPLSIEDVDVVSSLEEAYAVAKYDDISIIGGGQIYQLALSTIDEVIVTEINAHFSQAEVFFPNLDDSIWQETQRLHHDADEKNKYSYDFITYKRR